MDFLDKTVVLTGACGVHGRWIAKAFAAAGAKLCLSDMRDDALAALPAELGIASDRCLRHATELREERSIQALIDLVRGAWRAPDIVVNNAGIYPSGRLIDLPVDAWDRVMDVNLRAPFLLSRGFARLMIAEGVRGAIVNISSGAARTMRTGVVPYCISKTALDRLTKGLALELSAHDIRVNAVEPGFAPGSVVSPLSEDYVKAMIAKIPLGRASGPEDASQAILYLCSERASFITGATLSVDGGNSLGTIDPPRRPQGG